MKRCVLCAILLLTGCAKQPGDIVAAAVPADSYMKMHCEMLVDQRSGKQAELEALSSRQEETANRDAAWMAMVHMPVASMARGDDAERIAALKGELDAIDRASRAKYCRMPTPDRLAAQPQQ